MKKILYWIIAVGSVGVGIICLVTYVQPKSASLESLQTPGMENDNIDTVNGDKVPENDHSLTVSNVAVEPQSSGVTVSSEPTTPDWIKRALTRPTPAKQRRNRRVMSALNRPRFPTVTAGQILNASLEIPEAQKNIMGLAFRRGLINGSTYNSQYVETRMNAIVDDVKFVSKKELAEMDVSGTPPEFAVTVEKFIESFTTDEKQASDLLGELCALATDKKATSPAQQMAMAATLKNIYETIEKQNEQITDELNAFSQDYIQSDSVRAFPNDVQDNIQALASSGASADFVDAYKEYAAAVEQGDIEAISSAAWEMRYIEYRDECLAKEQNLDDIRDEDMDKVLGNLSKDVYKLNETYTEEEEAQEQEVALDDQILAADNLLYTKFISDTKDYWTQERRIPDREYSEDLSDAKDSLTECPEDFSAAYEKHLEAWDNLDYPNISATWVEVMKLTDKYKLDGSYSEEWQIDMSEAPVVEPTEEQRLAMEHVMESDYELTHQRDDSIYLLSEQKRIDDIANASIADCPPVIGDAYEEFVAANIYEFNTENNNTDSESTVTTSPEEGIDITITNEQPVSEPEEVIEYAGGKVEAVISEYLSSTITNELPEEPAEVISPAATNGL